MKRRASILAIVGASLGVRRALAAPSLKPQASSLKPRFWRATIHHTATPPDRPAERIRAIDADHRSRGWDGIGYHLLVAEDGGVFFGRPLERQGAHVKGENEGNLGVALIGDYRQSAPPEAALASVRRLLAWAFETWGFGPEAVYFHKDLAATECPGRWPKDLLFLRSPVSGLHPQKKEANRERSRTD